MKAACGTFLSQIFAGLLVVHLRIFGFSMCARCSPLGEWAYSVADCRVLPVLCYACCDVVAEVLGYWLADVVNWKAASSTGSCSVMLWNATGFFLQRRS